jgi:hypothetical protein
MQIALGKFYEIDVSIGSVPAASATATETEYIPV